MKTNKLTIVLVIIICILIGYIIFDHFYKEKNLSKEEEEVKLTEEINLDYANIYLLSDGLAYLEPYNKERIGSLSVDKNLKDRLNTLYERSFYYDIYLNGYKLRAFRIKLDDKIKSIKKINLDDEEYIIFLKDNNTIGLFNTEEYYDLLYTDVIDNYHNLKNVLDIKDNKIIYLDGSKEEFKIEEC